MFGHVVSVGGDCQPAHQLRRITGLQQAHVFDWLLVRADGVARLLDAGFADWLQPADLSLQAQPYACVNDARYGAQFLHDFALHEDFLQDLARVRAKYEVLVQRWQLLMASQASITCGKRASLSSMVFLSPMILSKLLPETSFMV